MDARQKIAADLQALLRDVTEISTNPDQLDTPIPGFLFDQIIAMIKLLLEWLGVIKPMTAEEYNQSLKEAKQRRENPNR